jgi:hypothetical protein
MKSLNAFINESLICEYVDKKYSIPVKDLYPILVKQGIKDHESWDKDWEYEDGRWKKPSKFDKPTIEGCKLIRAESINGKKFMHNGKKESIWKTEDEQAKLMCDTFKKCWDNIANIERDVRSGGSYGGKYYFFSCDLGDNNDIYVEYMGPLKELSKYKEK